jgi:hypothetical protein
MLNVIDKLKIILDKINKIAKSGDIKIEKNDFREDFLKN